MALTLTMLAVALACALGASIRATARLRTSVRALRVEAREWRRPGEPGRTC